MPENEAERAAEFLAVEVIGRRPTDPAPFYWVKLALSGLAFLLTFGLLDVLPKSYVRVIDRRNGAILLERAWGSPNTAAEEAAQIQTRLDALSVPEFCDEYGVTLGADSGP